MLSLPELQDRFGTVLAGDVTSALPIQSRGLSGEQRLQVYRNNMRSALKEALRTVYPVSLRLVGEEFFDAVAHAYVLAVPSYSGNIQDYGAGFPQFLREFPAAASLPYLGDVAELEWLRLQSAAASPHLSLDRTALAAVPQDRQGDLRFELQSALRLFSSRYPVLTIWQYCQASSQDAGLDIDLPGERVLIARPALDVYMRRMSPGEHAFLAQLGSGMSFEQACIAALESEPDFDVVGSFQTLVQEEIIVGFHP